MRRPPRHALASTAVAAAALALVACPADSDGRADAAPMPLPFPSVATSPPEDARPWARWWWPGGDVDSGTLRGQLERLAVAGFGGVEIQAFHAALGPATDEAHEARRRSYGSAEFWHHVRDVLDHAEALGLEVELTLGSGWPPGGPEVAPEDGQKALVPAERLVDLGEGPTTLDLSTPDLPHFYEVAAAAAAAGEPLAEWLGHTHAERLHVAAYEVTSDGRSDDFLVLDDTVTLAPGSHVDLTDRVGPDGTLTVSPETPGLSDDDWAIVAWFAVPTGQAPSLGATATPGHVLDPLADGAATAFLEAQLAPLREPDGSLPGALRGVFVDSAELLVERFWAADLPTAFEARRGHGFWPALPSASPPGADNHLFDGAGLPVASAWAYGDGLDGRRAFDVQQTLSELWVERFLRPLTEAAGADGLRLRLQGYGLNTDPLATLAAAAVPEVEQLYGGGPDIFLKMASSAAHVAGRAFASAEALVWAERDHTTTPTRAKAALDKLFAAGVTRPVLHGVPYALLDPHDGAYGEPGWHAFSSPWSGIGTYSSHVGERGGLWPDLPALNAYAARVSALLREGDAAVEWAVVQPWHGFPAAFARAEHDEPGFRGAFDADEVLPGGGGLFALLETFFGPPDLGERGAWFLARAVELAALHASGATWDWASPAWLAEATLVPAEPHGAAPPQVRLGAQVYGGVLLASLPSLAPEAAERLADLAEAGVPVRVTGEAPRRAPSAAAAEPKDARVRAALERVAAAATGGRLAPWLSTAQPLGPYELGHSQRRVVTDAGDGRIVFVHNPRRPSLATTLVLATPCRDAQWLDPWTGSRTLAGASEGSDPSAATRVPLALPAFGSRVLLCGYDAAPGGTPTWPEPPPATVTALGTGWALDLGLASPPTPLQPDADGLLPDWRAFDPTRHARGPLTYTHTLAEPVGPGGAVLDLGRVDGTAEVSADGVALGRLVVPPFRVTLPAGTTELAVAVTAAAINRYVGLALAGDQAYVQFTGRQDRLVPAGLRGPILLEP